jgi:hypothetical protein
MTCAAEDHGDDSWRKIVGSNERTRSEAEGKVL